MRILIGLIMSIAAAVPAWADNTLRPITDLSEFSGAKNATTIQWSNQRPEQQKALNQFYRSINPAAQTPEVSTQRQHHVQELRNMSPQQRQQMFLNYIQQNR